MAIPKPRKDGEKGGDAKHTESRIKGVFRGGKPSKGGAGKDEKPKGK